MIFFMSTYTWGTRKLIMETLKQNRIVCIITRSKNDATGQKNDFFSDFFFLLHIYTSRRNFFVVIKISYLQPFREIMGGQRIRKFSAKMTLQAKKMTFFRIFFSLSHLHIEAQLLCFYQNFISSAVQRNHGGAKNTKIFG